MESRSPRWSELVRRIADTADGAAEAAAGGMVKGAGESLREPELRAHLAQLVAEIVIAARRAAREPLEDGAPDGAATDLAAAITRGALEELDRQWERGRVPLHALVERLDQVLDTVEGMAASRKQHLIDPSRYARAAATEAVHGAVSQLHRDLAKVQELAGSLAPTAEDLARHLGRGAAEGLWFQAGERAESLAERAGRGLVKGLLAESPLPGLAYDASRAAVRGALDALAERLARPALATGAALGMLALASWVRARRR